MKHEVKARNVVNVATIRILWNLHCEEKGSLFHWGNLCGVCISTAYRASKRCFARIRGLCQPFFRGKKVAAVVYNFYGCGLKMCEQLDASGRQHKTTEGKL